MSKTTKPVYSEFGRTVGMVPFLEQDEAMKTCRDWTKSKCKCATEIIPMLEKYAELRTMDKIFGIEIPEKDKEGYENIEIYRRKGIKHWKECMPKPYCIPSIGELVLFSTFHWSIYNVNNKITKGDSAIDLYNTVLERIELNDGRCEIKNIEFIKTYRKIIEPEIEHIKENAFKQAYSKTKWTNWWEFW